MKKMTGNKIENNINIERFLEKYQEHSKIKKEKRSTLDKVAEFFATVLASTLYSYGFYVFAAIAGGISWYLGVDFDVIGITMIVLFVVFFILSAYVANVMDKRKTNNRVRTNSSQNNSTLHLDKSQKGDKDEV